MSLGHIRKLNSHSHEFGKMLGFMLSSVALFMPALASSFEFSWSDTPSTVIERYGSPPEYQKSEFRSKDGSSYESKMRESFGSFKPIEAGEGDCAASSVTYAPWRGPGSYVTRSLTYNFRQDTCTLISVEFKGIGSRGYGKEIPFQEMLEALKRKYGPPDKEKIEDVEGKGGLTSYFKSEEDLLKEGYKHVSYFWAVPEKGMYMHLQLEPDTLIDGATVNLDYLEESYQIQLLEKEKSNSQEGRLEADL